MVDNCGGWAFIIQKKSMTMMTISKIIIIIIFNFSMAMMPIVMILILLMMSPIIGMFMTKRIDWSWKFQVSFLAESWDAKLVLFLSSLDTCVDYKGDWLILKVAGFYLSPSWVWVGYGLARTLVIIMDSWRLSSRLSKSCEVNVHLMRGAGRSLLSLFGSASYQSTIWDVIILQVSA